MSCGACCSPLKPRYKRLVDSIYPDYAEDGLVNQNMQKLIYFAATSPEKWDRIGEYLAYRISRDLNRTYPRYAFVSIGMEAMDQLLRNCQSQHLNLYVESYLKTVQKLLECPEPDMQVRGSESFLQFAQKEQDVPAYHIRYDFFISKFCQMCHYETNEQSVTTKIRVSGLQGIGGVVRKIENEDLAENIWAPTHMDKIIPSLLYNIQIGDYKKASQGRSQTPDIGDDDCKSPLQIAEDTFRKLMGRAGFLSIRSVTKPILHHLDIHQMWTPPDFAEHVFQMVMFSIQQQVNYIIIEMLMAHLDKKTDNVMVKVGAARVLTTIFSSRAVDVNVGCNVLETINALLTHLKTSVDRAQVSRDPDPGYQRYHEALLTALGEYSSSLPNFQMIEIMMFILSKTPDQVSESDPVDSELQHMLLKALLTVAAKVVPVQFSNTFPITFLTPLLNKLHSPDSDVRLLVLRIFQTLIDRKANVEKLEQPTVEPRSDLIAQKPNSNKQDNNFFEKHGDRIYRELIRVIRSESFGNEYLEQFYITVSLLLLECNSDDNIKMQLDLIGELQDLAINQDTKLRLSDANKFSLHAVCISLLSTLSFVVRIPDIFEYKDKLVSLRKTLVPHLLPPLMEDYRPEIDPNEHIEAALIDLEPVKVALREAGRYVDRGSRGQSVKTNRGSSPNINGSSPRNSWIDSASAHKRKQSLVSQSSVHLEVDSCASSPGIIRRPAVMELSFAEMKRALAEPTSREKEAEERAKKQLIEKFQTASFAQLCEFNSSNRHSDTLYHCLSDIYNKSTWNTSVGSSSRKSSLTSGSFDTTDVTTPDKINKPKKNIYEDYFPELFTY